MSNSARIQFAVCVDNTDYEASLILGKVYRVIRDDRATEDGLVRVIDESGEDYLFDQSQFVFVDFPKSIEKKLLALPTSAQQTAAP